MMNGQEITKEDIYKKWQVVLKFSQSSHRQAQLPGGPFINETPPNEYYNLALVLAYEVLEDALQYSEAIGLFKRAEKKRDSLKYRMEQSKGHLDWIAYDLVNQGRDARNTLAHEGTLHSKTKCLAYVAAVQAELKNWRLVQ